MNIAEKIKKLLALAASSNEHEAALAASMAQELMVKYAIEEDSLKGTIPAETIETEKMGFDYGRVPRWEASLAHGMARAFFCRSYYSSGGRWHKGDIWMVGRKTDREAFKTTFLYIRDRINELADKAWAKWNWENPGNQIHGKTWKRGFYMGAVHTIVGKMNESMKKLVADNTGMAIVLANRQKDVDAIVDKMRMRRTSSSGRINPTGYYEGKAAGHSIDVNRRTSRRALPGR